MVLGAAIAPGPTRHRSASRGAQAPTSSTPSLLTFPSSSLTKSLSPEAAEYSIEAKTPCLEVQLCRGAATTVPTMLLASWSSRRQQLSEKEALLFAGTPLQDPNHVRTGCRRRAVLLFAVAFGAVLYSFHAGTRAQATPLQAIVVLR